MKIPSTRGIAAALTITGLTGLAQAQGPKVKIDLVPTTAASAARGKALVTFGGVSKGCFEVRTVHFDRKADYDLLMGSRNGSPGVQRPQLGGAW
jgi:hypothetical protein